MSEQLPDGAVVIQPNGMVIHGYAWDRELTREEREQVRRYLISRYLKLDTPTGGSEKP